MDNSGMDNATQRKIIHCDCDCFYAAVEMRDTPALRDKPVAVGGAADRRGVVATCNYAAREYGIHSAMPMARATALCPALVVIPPDFEKYRHVSQQIRGIFRDLTPEVEPLSLDEAYLDVSEVRAFRRSGTLMAQHIKARVRDEVGIVISAGVAPNKFLAKIASDWDKPDGLFVIAPEAVDAFVETLPVGKLFGVGRVTEQKLLALGARTCGELRDFDLQTLSAHFGVMGERLYELCRGIDTRVVKTRRHRKSLSVETTFARDLTAIETCRDALQPLYERLLERYQQAALNDRRLRHFLKIRFADFTVTTIERRLPGGISLSGYQALCEEAWQRKRLPVRLLGIGVRVGVEPATDISQYRLFD